MNRLLHQLWQVGNLGLPLHPPPRAPVHPADLGDTSRCPLRERCTGCGRDVDDLAVHVFDLDSLGTACLTLCPTCAAATVSLRVGLGAAVTLVGQHAAHVGADVATEELLRKRFHHHHGQLLCRPRARTGPIPGSATEGAAP